MGAVHVPLADIEDPFEAVGWRVSRPDDEGTLHAEVLRELCDRALALHVGAAGTRGVTATLQFVDLMQQQLVLASHDDGIAIARALQGRPAWAAALLHGLRVQFVLAAPCAAREGTGVARSKGLAGAHAPGERVERGERFLIQARWPREIYRTSRRLAPRVVTGAARPPSRGPVVRFCGGHYLVSTRNLRVLDISELGCAVMLPAGVVPPAPGSDLPRVELELDDTQVIVADARVQHVAALGRNAHRIGCRWENMSAAGQLALRRWLAQAGPEASAAAAVAPAPSMLPALAAD
ncbi:MAG: PilZ domain-containing protein [Rubrivivax sp.]|nr:PilZ domain-containing protein [Rubrivivax sp.]